MTTDRAEYFDELTRALRDAGVPEDQAEATVSELNAHLVETGGTAEDEFGPAVEFAELLSGGAPGPATEPGEETETWTWTADINNDLRLLAVHGDQGWEVERLDGLGRFVCRRVRGSALRWEYRREIVGGRRRAEVLDRLTPEGWEICGQWLFYAYFKRTKAASTGPAAALDAPPPAPRRTYFFSRPMQILLAAWALSVTALVVMVLTGTYALPWYASAACAALGAAAAAYGLKRDLTKAGED
ncbi:hypothetical protein [Streptomyces sp. NPDC059176]|uniref:hypothetical protein n=1 Tax=unclassified Streptomyces TaxID=2593676 RepID=UPI003698033A